jgi:hypothetical protein
MKNSIVFMAAACVILGRIAYADGQISNELRAAVKSHEAAVQAAVGPLNHRHAGRLEEILGRALASNDKQAIIDTLIELRKLGPEAVQYAATAVIGFFPSDEINAEQVLRKFLKDDPFFPTITRLRNTGLFEVKVIAADSKFAADHANDVATVMKQGLATRPGLPPVTILEKAEPPKEPLVPGANP